MAMCLQEVGRRPAASSPRKQGLVQVELGSQALASFNWSQRCPLDLQRKPVMRGERSLEAVLEFKHV